MKNFISFLLFLFATCFAAAQQNTATDLKVQKKIAASEQINAEKLNEFAHERGENTTDYDVKYYRLAIEINPTINFIKGNVTAYFMPVSTAGLSQITFDCAAALTVDSAKYHGTHVTFSIVTNEQRTFYLPNQIAENSLDSLTIFYRGTPVSTGFGSFYKGTHGSNNVPVIWTFSVPYGAKDWWICKNTLTDKADSLDLFIKTPNQFLASGNGKLKSVLPDNDGISHTFHWQHRYPITSYLVATAVTNYISYSDYLVGTNSDSLEILNFVYPESLAAAQQGTAALLPVLSFFEEKFGSYPFRSEKYGHAQFGWGGGMEHQTMSYVTNFDKSLLAHELSHQWFGDAVTCGSFRDVWLNEGFATYATALVDEKFNLPAFKTWKSSTINAVVGQAGGSVYCPDTSNFNRIFDYRLTYQKGAMVLHMLRWVMGDSAFFKGIKAYVSDTSLLYNYSRTAQLQAHLEVASGSNLTSFFQKWFYSEGYPKYDLRWAQSADGKMTLKINQTTSHPSVSFYEMPLTVRLKNATLDTFVTFNHVANGQIEQFYLSFIPNNITLDPDNWIVCKKTITKDISLKNIDISNENLVTLSPNPVSNTLTITSSVANVQKIMCYDWQGKLLMQKSFAGDEQVVLDTFSLPTGATYTIKIILTNQQIVTKKVVKL